MKQYKMTSKEKRQTLTIDLHEENYTGSYAVLFKAMQDGATSRRIALKLNHRPDIKARLDKAGGDREKLDAVAAEILELL